MADQRSIGEIVTEFMFKTRRPHPPPVFDTGRAAICCGMLAAKHPDDEPEADCIPVTTGSIAEFYSEPMLSCIGDVDLMYHLSTELAVPTGYPPPTQLPADFDSDVRLFEIIDSGWPGYVYLNLSHLLTECSDDGGWTAWRYEEQQLYPHKTHSYIGAVAHGPAVKKQTEYRSIVTRLISVVVQSQDTVYCVRCLVWPPQATDWSTRHRKFGWPDAATVDRVVSNGCDVVGVAHRQCRQDDWEGEHQWRLSFSRAEVVLLNSWMPVQQIVYHMLRFFTKTSQMTDSADNSETKTLSTYHIKTLMLWACELKPRDWWTDDLNCVRICATLLHTLAAWIRYRQCPHYFVKDCNLFDHDKSDAIAAQLAEKLTSITEYSLSLWFVDNYIQNCAKLCPQNISWMLVDIRPTTLVNAVPAIVCWRQRTWFSDYVFVCLAALYGIAHSVHFFSLTARSTRFWIKELEKLDRRLTDFFIAVVFFHAERLISEGEQRCYEFLTTCCLYLNDRTTEDRSANNNTMQLFKKAKLLLKSTAKQPISDLKLIQTELSKVYLQNVLQLEPGDYSLCCLSNIYLAVLYYTTRHYQTAVDHSALVTRTHDDGPNAQRCSLVVEGEVLPKIDDDIDNVLGLASLYEYIRAVALRKKQYKRHVSIITAKLFAFYLQTKCLESSPMKPSVICQYHMCVDRLKDLFVADVLLLKLLLKRLALCKSVDEQKRPVGKCANLSQLLLKSAVERLTAFRQMESLYFASVATIVTTDFEALYAYRCGEYQHCLQLCRQNVQLLVDGDNTLPAYAVFPDFIRLLDDESAALVGLVIATNPGSRHHIQYIEATVVSQLTLSLYLLTQCQLKLCDAAEMLRLTLTYIKLAQQKHARSRTLDHLSLRLTERKLVSDEALEQYAARYADMQRKHTAFFQLKLVLGPCVEALILLDRLVYLLEQDTVSDAYIVQLFDAVKSPRCYALVAVKSTTASTS